MPCPPSYEEQQFFRMDREIGAINDQLAKEQDEIDLINTLLFQVRDMFSSPLETSMEEKFKLFTKRNFRNGAYSFSQTGIDEENVRRYAEYVDEAQRMIYYAEVHKCELRTLLMNMWRLLPEYVQNGKALVNEKVKQERKLHLIHRVEDRDYALNVLKKEFTNENNQENKEVIAKKIEYILSIAEEELLYRRDLF